MKRLSKRDAALLIGFCVVATLFALDALTGGDDGQFLSYSSELRRAGRKLNDHGAGVLPWARENLKSLSEAPDPAGETPLFWTIPKSGSTEAKSIYACLDLTTACRSGDEGKPRELVTYRPWGDRGPSYVNVDTTSEAGILRAGRLGLVPSGVADLIFTPRPSFAVAHLYDGEHKGRALGLFRHPVDRLVSKFYYLQVADWERTYSPGWANIKIQVWARVVNRDNNNYVRSLTGVTGSIREHHLQMAMATLRESFVVGLTDRMEESVRRYNVVMGIDESSERHSICMDRFFGENASVQNSNSHPKVEKGSTAWKILARTNKWDMRLYEYILKLFDEQRSIIDSYAQTVVKQE